MSHIYIYNDAGTAERGVCYLKAALSRLYPHESVAKITAQDVIRGLWRADAKALIMPGGRDLLYGAKLNGFGNQCIRDYVTSGGLYIGICAGAYYGARYCEFHKGDPEEVCGLRELSFFNGAAVGPTLAPYVYDSEEGARIAHLQWGTHQVKAYYNGGCHFPEADTDPQVTVLAHYNNDNTHGLPAIIACYVGAGRAILSGVHPEYPLDGFSHNDALFALIYHYANLG